MAIEPSGRRFRVHGRRPLRLPVTVTHAASGWRCDARLLNVGLGGACVELTQPLEPGERLVLEVTAPHLWDPLRVEAEAAWTQALTSAVPARAPGLSSPPPPPAATVRAGVRFEHADADAVLALFQVIAAATF